jgi:hypothetical protein
MKTTEQEVRTQMKKDFEQVRASDRQQIQQPKTSLDELHKNSQDNREMAIQQGELIKQLQAKIDLSKVTTVEMETFQDEALEVHEKMELAPQDLFTKVEVVQNCYWVADISLNKIYIKEREAIAARAKFQESILIEAKDEVAEVPRLSLF